MTAAKNVYALMLALVIVLSGCFGNSTDPVDADDDDDNDDANWINDRGTGNQTWTISVEDDQWLEIQSITMLKTYDNGEEDDFNEYQISSILIEDDGWEIAGGHSPIFGGDYTMCAWHLDGDCYSEYPYNPEDHEIRHWSIIYRIHEV